MSEQRGPGSSVAASTDVPDSLGQDGPSRADGEVADYRELLRSRRWHAAPLRNPEVEKTDPRIAVFVIALLAVATLIVLVVGYASGFWELPSEEDASGAMAALVLLA